ncbi:helix-turn-helix transcriptional regulator (plasmid) [Aminobacter sp. SR38]|jgi:AraC-like DNA-binding protein|uniref:AraC family transcriptional regulator n=1 Tax=Aminobacter sp. SR38 TaxID=2774562 RepID=UPI001784B758|nr:AraC family transcriptional regulator [Aminobacter sp. SR38]QOF74507.1 helix-turn-helix transcriptional regulator [Aminobacter sp. SR38]
MQAGTDPNNPALACGEEPEGFRLARIRDLQDLEGGVYWPRLQPHFLNPHFKLLRYKIQEGTGSDRTPRVFSVRGASGVGELDVAYIADRLAASLTVTESGIPDYCLTAVSRGALEFGGGARTVLGIDRSVGLVYRGEPGTTLSATGSHERLSLWIPAKSLNQRLAALLGGPVPKDLAFEPVFDWGAMPAQSLRRLMKLMVEELGAPTPFSGSELASRSFTDLMLYTLLRAVPHNHSDHLARTGSSAIPGTIRRAEAYIHAHLEEPIALHEVAEAAGCSVRSLQLGFRRFRETTPLASIRLARLVAVRDALRSGDIAGTVTDLALRFGFTNPGRFAHDYKAVFGETPREALRRDSGHRRPGR